MNEINSPNEVPFELQALSRAINYQKWVFESVQKYLGTRILEIGAGVGNMSRWLRGAATHLCLTECDGALVEMLKENVKNDFRDHANFEIKEFNIDRDSIDPYIKDSFDTIVSFNVLEHVENDILALRKQCEILRSSQTRGPKRLVIFVPAHDWSYGTMDATFGHYRRYSKTTMSRIHGFVAPEAKLELKYINIVGLIGWLVNGKILRKRNIGISSILAFEKLCPLLRLFEKFWTKLLPLPFGQSLLVVFTWDEAH